MVINKQNYVCQDLEFMQKWVVNGLFGAPTEPIKNRSAVAVWGLGRRFGPNCGLWRSLVVVKTLYSLKT